MFYIQMHKTYLKAAKSKATVKYNLFYEEKKEY